MNSELIVIFLIFLILLVMAWFLVNGHRHKSRRRPGRSGVQPKGVSPPKDSVDKTGSSSEGFDTHVAEIGPLGGPEPAVTQLLVQPSASMAWLVKRSGPVSGREFRLGYVNKIGRRVIENDIAVDDLMVSRFHAKIRLENGRFVIYDTSRHGTFVNGIKINRCTLHNGDTIAIGAATFVLLEVR